MEKIVFNTLAVLWVFNTIWEVNWMEGGLKCGNLRGLVAVVGVHCVEWSGVLRLFMYEIAESDKKYSNCDKIWLNLSKEQHWSNLNEKLNKL